MPKIVLIGDSTIDNRYWVNPGETVQEELQALRPEDDIVNLAIDGFTTENILHGGHKDKAVESAYHTHAYFKPLNQLSQHRDASHVVLSVGGNDFREKLQCLIALPPESRPDNIDDIMNGIAHNYIQIIVGLKKALPKAKISVMLQYTPHVNNDIYFIYFLMLLIANRQEAPAKGLFATKLKIGAHLLLGMSKPERKHAVSELHKMMAKVYEKIFPALIRLNINVIDLAASFDYRDKSLYVSQIEPSARGSKLIASLMNDSMNLDPTESLMLARTSDSKNPRTAAISLEQGATNWTPGSIWSASRPESDTKPQPQ
jgi:hypothetical protein